MARRAKKKASASLSQGPSTIAVNGTWMPAPATDIQAIAQAAIDILTRIGMSDAPPAVIEMITGHGGSIDDGRLLFPISLIESVISHGPKSVTLAGGDPKHDMIVGADRTYVGTGGAAPRIKDHTTGVFRASNLHDLHAAARLADALDHVDFFARSLVAGDITDPQDFDIATAMACLLGTAKHVFVQASHPNHVLEIAKLCYDISGGPDNFRARPFLSLNINHVVPPLRLHPEACDVLIQAVRLGIPVHCNVFGQLGASSPVTLAGSVAQTLAETLAGLAIVHAIDPNAPRIAGPRPMITDLRTGGMAGGAGEQITATALAVQVLRHWDIPCSVIAGATDSKVPDFQAGYEKALTINTALQAGANLITQAIGTQAGLMAVDFAAMVADNEMIGAILRANSKPDISDETLNLSSIRTVVQGDGHFLGQPETYERMRSDFLYPDIADRSSIDAWAQSDQRDMGQRAKIRADEILDSHWPSTLPDDITSQLNQRFKFPHKAKVKP